MSVFRNVVVGISGGVDSAVAALLLKKKGFNVMGVFMRNWDLIDENGTCTSMDDLEDAKFVCERLKIPLKEVNFVKEYWNEVFVNFTNDYEKGVTPNPDIMCNKHIKFKKFFNYAMNDLKADAIAMGHYVRTSFGDFLENYEPGEKVRLLKAKDSFKDQTFFLSQVSQESLRKTMFPLGNLTKDVVRSIATENGLEKIASKPESMGICFIGSRKFKKFISEYVKPRPGNFINITTGRVEGVHEGIHLYTLGERCRIGGVKEPLYIVRKIPQTSDILVAPGLYHPATFRSLFFTEPPHWLAEPPDLSYLAELDFRFQHVKGLSEAFVYKMKNEELVTVLKRPLRALTEGQFSVYYKGDECLGSARITLVGPSEFSLGKEIPQDYVEYLREKNCAVNSVS